jgi:beta-lactam-binding protein with PASTA domain
VSRNARRLVLGLALAIVAVGVVAAAVALLGGVSVPNVVGKTQAAAVKALEDAGLKVGKVTQADDPEAAPGTVLLQDPAAGTDVDDGAAVALTVSAGPGTAAVPDVVGMTGLEAEATLADAGVVPASVSQNDLVAPAGEVVDQLPGGGEQAAVGTQVGVIVSKGRPEVQVSVPDVTGMARDAATAALADAGLVAVPVEAYSADLPKDQVIEQEPPSGERVPALSEVLISVSLGEGTTTVTVPDVVGMTKAKAADTLVAAGLTVTAAHAWSGTVEKDVCIAQAPEPGEKVQKGGDAGILVSLGPLPSPSPSPSPTVTESPPASPTAEPSSSPSASPTAMPPIVGPEPPVGPPELTATVPDVVGADAAQAQEQLTDLGLRPVPLETGSAEVPAGQVIAQLPEAGKKVPKTYPVLLLVSIGAGPQANPSSEGSEGQ